MKILLVRHGTRDREGEYEQRLPLTDTGRKECDELADELRRLDFEHELCLTSGFKHSIETANMISAGARVVELDALTPPLKKFFAGDEKRAKKLKEIAGAHPTKVLNYIIDDARAKNVVLKEKNVIIIVGHEPRLGQLFTRLTSRRIGPLGNGEAICVEGSWDELMQGNGRAAFKIPVIAPDTETLMDKVHRKMEVCVFLAGFSVPALVEVLKDTKAEMELSRAVSALAFTFSLAFYVAAVYIL
jgi:broad specificity phosphatase PhoE